MKSNFNKYIIKIILATFVLVIIAQMLFIGGRSILESNSYIPIKSDKLLVGEPIVVDLKDIKTTQYSKSENSTYSQVKVKNISKETLYHITINLEDRNKKEEKSELNKFRLAILEPGEEALLTTNIDTKQIDIPHVENYSYRDDKNNLFEISTSDKNNKMIVTNFEAYFHHNTNLLFKEISKDIDKLRINNIRSVNDGNDNYIEVDVENISDSVLNNICITFEEIYNNVIIGNNYEGNISKLDPYKESTIRIKHSKDISLNLISYGYSLVENSNNKDDSKSMDLASYDIYPNQDKYIVYIEEKDSESVDNVDRGLIISIAGLKVGIWCGLLFIIKRYFNKKLENGVDILKIYKKMRLIDIIGTLVLGVFALIVFLVCFML